MSSCRPELSALLHRSAALLAGGVLVAVVLPVAAFADGGADASPQTYTVTSAGDDGQVSADAGCVTAAGGCTLRAAIEAANAGGTPASIQFALPSDDRTISPHSALPAITVPVVVDGYSQSGSSVATESAPAAWR